MHLVLLKHRPLIKSSNFLIGIIPTTKSDSIRARYEAKVEGLDQLIKELESSLENKKEPDFEEALNLILKLLGTPAETWKNVDLEKKTMVHKMIFTENPKYSFLRGFGTIKLSLPFYIKDYLPNITGDLVDWDEKTWNTFFDIILSWEPVLRQISALENEENELSLSQSLSD